MFLTPLLVAVDSLLLGLAEGWKGTCVPEDPEQISAGARTDWVGSKCFRGSKNIRAGKRLVDPLAPRCPIDRSTAVGRAMTILSDMAAPAAVTVEPPGETWLAEALKFYFYFIFIN